jgi:hypothetical protein
LLIRAAEPGERDREADECVVVAGSDRLGALDDGGRDRVGAGGAPASLDAGCRVGVAVEYGGLRLRVAGRIRVDKGSRIDQSRC